MDEYKPITGELRSYVRRTTSTSDNCWWMATDTQNVRDLCDNIDSVHAQLERDYARLKAERDSMAAALDAAQGEHAYAPESHYVMLPKDADGEPIHIGDVMEWASYDEDLRPAIRTVNGVGEHTFFAWNEGGGRYAQYEARAYRHYLAPTVEDVLREFVERWHDTHHDDIPALFAEYAAKLRLVGES